MNDLIGFLLGMAVFLPANAMFLMGRLKRHHYAGLLAVASGIWAVHDIHTHSWPSAALQTAFAAWEAWAWWKGGGGDDTKKRLRKWSRAFTPNRRTAPSAA